MKNNINDYDKFAEFIIEQDDFCICYNIML